MAATKRGGSAARPLGLLGVDPADEHAYHVLLEQRAATVSKVARRMRISARAARQLLVHLEAQGLATHTPEMPRVYVAAPPELAVTALIKQRQAELESVRVVIPDLEAHAARAGAVDGREPPIELLHSGAHLSVLMAKIYESFRSEAMCFQRAPLLTPEPAAPGERPDPTRVRTIDKYPAGVRIRTVSDTSYLNAPGALAQLEADVIRGEHARVLPLLPFKMMIFDRRIAVVAVDGAPPEQSPTLLIRGAELLKAFCQMFEFVWERATPVALGHSGRLKAGAGVGHSEEQQEALLALLSAGFNDKAIALEMGISPATLNRRISDLMRATGTRTRFQLGWHAALAEKKTR